ncbi:hypothetical protein JNUCC0626_50455 (plasmid) [Lentzea sp. JNUCC 0626]|uniref:hypothetical protein n=1 Tax=Lentzea sp. JNUCC 0626 TaxID=3367513 RepID=UPI00374A4D9A
MGNHINGTVYGTVTQIASVTTRTKAVAVFSDDTDLPQPNQQMVTDLVTHLTKRAAELREHLPHSRPAHDEVEAVLAILTGTK